VANGLLASLLPKAQLPVPFPAQDQAFPSNMNLNALPQPPPVSRARNWLGTLPLQYKAWGLTCLLIIGVSAAMSLGVYHTLKRSFDRMEHRQVTDHAERLRHQLAQMLDNLDRVGRDYANWDQTSDYATQPYQAYEDANLNDSTLDTLQLQALLIFNTRGKLVGGKTMAENSRVVKADPEIWQELLDRHLSLALAKDPVGVRGYLRLPDGRQALYACIPIHRSGGTGPAVGSFVMIRVLDERVVGLLRELSGLQISLDKTQFRSEEPIERTLTEQAMKEGFSWHAVDANWLAFHVVLPDIEGRNIGHFHCKVERVLHQQGRRAQLILYTGIFSITVIAGFGMLWLMRSLVIARLETLHAEVRRIGSGANPDARVSMDGQDEIAGLGREINLMLEGLVYVEARHAQAMEATEKLEAQLVHAQKMEAIGTMAGGLAHDFNNMLNSILGSADLLRYELPANHPAQENIRRIEKAGASAAALVQQLLAVSRKQQHRPEALRLGETVQDAMKLLQAALPRNIEFRLQQETANDFVMADMPQMHQVIMNLATNAAHAMAGRETARFTITIAEASLPDEQRPETKTLPPGDYIRMTLADTGAGIPTENLDHIFEPFFTTKPRGAGTGLGLAVVHGIIGKHSGSIGVESRLGSGTQFIIHLPRLASPPANLGSTLATNSSAPQAQRSTAETGGEAAIVASQTKQLHILLVDDDPMVCDTLANGLRRLGHLVHAVNNTGEALRMIADPGIEISVLVTDQMMPGMNGTELGSRIQALRPGLPMILVSAYAATLEEEHVLAHGFTHLLRKPLTAGQLSQAVLSTVHPPRGARPRA